MTTPFRQEVQFEDLPEASSVAPNAQTIVRNPVTGQEELAYVSQFPHPDTQPSSWHTGTTPPPSPIAGAGWYDTSTTPNEFKIWDGTKWLTIGPGDLAAIMQSITDEANARDSAIKAEADLRVAGDEVQVETINSSGDYVDFARDQVNEDSPAYVLFNIALTDGTTNIPYVAGGLYRFPPGSLQSKRIPLPKQAVNPVSTPEIGGGIGIVPKNIDVYTALDGDSTMSVAGLNQEFLKAKNPDQYEVWYKFEGVHTMNPPKEGNGDFTTDFTFTYNISTSEETQIGLLSTDKIVPVRLVMRKSGQFVGQLVTFLTIGDDESGTATPTDPERLISTGASLSSLFVDKTAEGVKSWQIAFVNPDAIPSSGYWYNADVAGQPSVEGRRAWDGSSAVNWTVSDGNAAQIAQVPEAYVDVNLYIYTSSTGRASDFVARRRFRAFFRGSTEGGLDEAQVDARVQAGVLDWAETGNTDDIPLDKIDRQLLIGAMTSDITPSGLPNANAETLAREYNVTIGSSHLIKNDENWYEFWILSQRVKDRTAWAGGMGPRTFTFTIDATKAQALATELTGLAKSMNVELRVFDSASGGNQVGFREDTVQLTQPEQGITESEAEALIKQEVADWAETGNTDEIPAAKIPVLGGTRWYYREPGAALPKPIAGHALIDGDDNENVYKYRPKTLVPRSTPFGLSDFQRQDGTYQRWRGLTPNYLTLSGAADGDVAWQTTAAGRTQGFYARAGGGWSPVANNHAPASFAYYADLAAATAAATVGQVVLYGTDGVFVVESILAEAWVPDVSANNLVGTIDIGNMPERLRQPGTVTQSWQTRQPYQRVAYDSSKFTAYGVDRGQFMVGESSHDKQVMFHLRDEDTALSTYIVVGLGFGGRDDTTTVLHERIEKIDLASGGRVRLTLAEGGFSNFSANADVYLEAQSKVDQRLEQVELRPRPGAARSVTGSVTIDTLAFNPERITLIADAEINLSTTGAIDGQVFELRVTQDGTGGRALTFNSAIVGSEPTINTGANERTILFFEYIGTAWEIVVAR